MSNMTGWTKPQRAARRQMYLDRELDRARRVAGQCDRSMKCAPVGAWPARHATDPDGCRNDGSTCLCECHDPEGASHVG